MARGDAPRRPTWTTSRQVFALALVGAWLGHFIEYVRVSGWHGGVAQMSGADHVYFMPAGAALVGLVIGASLLLRRAWRTLDDRLRIAEAFLRWPMRRRPPEAAFATGRSGPRRGAPGVTNTWIALTLLQTGIWVAQENLESIAAGRHAPLLGVLSGAHALAPVVLAEVALLLTGVYVLMHRTFSAKALRTAAIEHLAVRKWLRCTISLAFDAWRVPTSTPLQRWGAQRWQRPPPQLRIA